MTKRKRKTPVATLPPPVPQHPALPLLPGEKLYKLYRIELKWSEPTPFDKIGKYKGHWIAGLNPGLHWNGTGYTVMPKGEVTIEQLEAEALEEFYKVVYDREKPSYNWGNRQITAKYLYEETWCLTWFNHWTHDTFASDADVVASFNAYVRRTECHNARAKYTGEGEERCLMGAEDRWRWRGATGRGGPNDETTPPPCRCEACKEQGVVRINH